MRQLVRLSVSRDNFVFYFSTVSWLQLQQVTMWVNIKFERRDLASVQKIHPSLDDFGEAFACNKTKCNSFFFQIFNKKLFSVPMNNLNFNLPLTGTVSFSTSYQWCLIRQGLLISASSLLASATSPPWLSHQTAIFKIR